MNFGGGHLSNRESNDELQKPHMSGSTRAELMMKEELVQDLEIWRYIPEISKWSKTRTATKLRN